MAANREDVANIIKHINEADNVAHFYSQCLRRKYSGINLLPNEALEELMQLALNGNRDATVYLLELLDVNKKSIIVHNDLINYAAKHLSTLWLTYGDYQRLAKLAIEENPHATGIMQKTFANGDIASWILANNKSTEVKAE